MMTTETIAASSSRPGAAPRGVPPGVEPAAADRGPRYDAPGPAVVVDGVASRRSLRTAATREVDQRPVALGDGARARSRAGIGSAVRALVGGVAAKVRWRVSVRALWAAVLCLTIVGGAVALRAAAAPAGAAVELPVTLVTPSAGAPGADGAVPGTTDDDRSGEDEAARPVVLVHVVGEVGAAGVVELSDGSRVADAIAAAGGAGAEADLSALNLAEVVTDGQQVRVPRTGEEPVVAAGAAGPGPGSGSAGLVDLNRADAATLETLPGIGPVLAERIAAWRTERGRFATVDDLQQVSGIGPALLEKLRPRVTV